MLRRYVQIPDAITVHLGGKDADAPNITLPFVDYLKGCAACLICPTWPEHAQRANIYAITSFALHRVSRKWYRARGCAFDITGSAQDDLPFSHEACLFCNTNCLVEEMFNNYLTRHGSGEPLPAQICPSGRQAVGSGVLCQNDAVVMAQKGYTAYDILRKYYGEDIVIIENAPRQGERERFLGTPLMCGASGDDICTIKRQLNRIGQNYPAIALLDADNPDFDPPCERAIRTFQYIFDLPVTGVLDKATWYGIKRTCAGIEQSDAAPFEQRAAAVMKPVSFSMPPANLPQAATTSNGGVRQEIAAGRMPSLVVPGRIIPGNPLPSVIIPGSGTLDSVISDSGIAEEAEREGAQTGVTPEDNAVENAARWEATRQSIMQGAADTAPLSSIIADRGIASRAEAANGVAGQPVQDHAIFERVDRSETPQGRAARSNAARMDIPPELGITASPVRQPQSPADHLVKIGPSVSTALSDVESGVDSGHAVEWLRKFYDL